jgi:caffeoyl-CoA O-methyltransferase
MLCGKIEGRLLKMLVQLTQARSALEIGTFTGYSALSIAEGLPSDGQLTTCDIDEECASMARAYFAKSPHGHKIKLKMGNALDTIRTLETTLDFVFIDADKENYVNYSHAVLPKVRSGGLIVFDNSLWSGLVLDPPKGDKESQAIAEVNNLVALDERVESVLLCVRDGINLVRKR